MGKRGKSVSTIIYAQNYSLMELMAAAIAREFRDQETAFVGVGPPLIAAMVGKLTDAPNLTIAVEGGTIGSSPRRLLTCIADTTICERAYSCGTMWRNFGDQQRGFYDVGVIGGAQIDKYGNVNATALGDYNRPSVRVAGSGGANDIGSSVGRYSVMMRQEKRRFVERVDYLTVPGYLDGGDARIKAGLPGGGPHGVITTMGIFRFDEESGEMYLDKCHPGITPEKVKENVGWDLKMAPSIGTTEPPTQEQVEIMRVLDPYGLYLGSGREGMGDVEKGFDFYMEVLDKSYDAMTELFRQKGL
jgi:glutaconate CoA-transferase subunit B